MSSTAASRPATRIHAWLKVTPRPQTLSESSAILRHVQTYGVVSSFSRPILPRRTTDKIGTANETFDIQFASLLAPGKAIVERSPAFSNPVVADRSNSGQQNGTGITNAPRHNNGTRPSQSNLVDVNPNATAAEKARLTANPDTGAHARRRVSTASSECEFEVEANPARPSPQVLDPYNVRGLQSRKPDTPPRRFHCKMTIEEREPKSPAPATDAEGTDTMHERLAGPFKPDENSIFKRILRSTDVPPHLAKGLLPVLECSGNKDAPRRRRPVPCEHVSLVELYKQGQLKRSQKFRV